MANLQALTGLAVAACLATASFAVNGQAMGVAPKPSLTGWVPAVENLPGGGWRVVPNSHIRVRDQQIADAILRRIWSTEGGKIVAKDGIRIAGRAGELIVQAAKRLSVAEAGAVVARCLASPVCVAAAAAAGISVALWNHYRVRPAPGGGLEYDEGQAENIVNGYTCTSGTKIGNGLTPDEACVDAANKDAASLNRVTEPNWAGCVVSYQFTVGAPVNNRVPVTQTATYSGPTQQCVGPTQTAVIGWVTGATPAQFKMCPAVVDFEDPSKSTPGQIGWDGKCNTGRYAPISSDAAVEKLVQVPPDLEKLRDAVREAVDSGMQDAPAAQELTGPESQTGTPESSTTTGPEGTTTTTKTPVYNYTYAGDTITYQTTYRTETCTGANSCSTTTTTPPKPTEQDPEDPCTAAPDRAGCAKLGTPPSPEDLKKKDVPVSITPESGFGAGTGTCPGPIQLLNGATVDPFGLVCTYMAGIRFAIIGVAWLMAALIFLGRVD